MGDMADLLLMNDDWDRDEDSEDGCLDCGEYVESGFGLCTNCWLAVQQGSPEDDFGAVGGA